MKKNKTVKKNPAPKKPVIKQKPKKVVKALKTARKWKGDIDIQNTILNALNHLLDLAKGQLFDMFKMYVQSKTHSDSPATLEDFTTAWSHTLAKHGVSDEELLAALAPHQKEYLFESAKKIESGVNTKPKKPTAAKEASIKANPLSAVAASNALTAVKAVNAKTSNKPSGVTVQEDQAAKINTNDFGLDLVPAPAAVSENSKKPSVFADLEIL